MSRRLVHSSIPSLGLFFVLTLAGCGASAGEAGEAAPSTSAASSSSVSTPMPDPPATVEPADGPWLEVPNARIRVPKGWVEVASLGVVVSRGNARRSAYASLTQAFVQDTSLDGLARGALRDYLPPGSKRLEDVTVAGGTVSAVHLTGRDDRDLVHTYGIVNLGGAWLVRFNFSWDGYLKKLDMPEGERQELMDSVLATFEIVYKE